MRIFPCKKLFLKDGAQNKQYINLFMQTLMDFFHTNCLFVIVNNIRMLIHFSSSYTLLFEYVFLT